MKRDKDTKSLLKLLFHNSEKASTTVTSTTTPVRCGQVKEESAEAPDVVMETAESFSLIEQIRLKAQFLRETKVIDKVSIASSNFDEYNANDFCNTEDDAASKGNGVQHTKKVNSTQKI